MRATVGINVALPLFRGKNFYGRQDGKRQSHRLTWGAEEMNYLIDFSDFYYPPIL